MPAPSLRIAIVEPDQLACERLRRHLARSSGYAVVAAYASAAQARLDPTAADVVIVDASTTSIETSRRDHLALAVRGGVVLVAHDDITHAEFDGVLVTVHRRGQPPVLTTLTLQQLAQRLGDARFLRSHRRALLNLDAVQQLHAQEHGGYLAELAGGITVPVSRQVARRLRRELGLARAQPSAPRAQWHGEGGRGGAATHHRHAG